MALQDYYNTGDDTFRNAYDFVYIGQTFTTTGGYDIGSIRLKLYRFGSPGMITVEIQETTSFEPNGSVLASGTIDGNALTSSTSGEWVTATFGAPAALIGSTRYAIIIKAPSGDASNSIRWRADGSGPAYGGGLYVYSTSSGASWNTGAAYDMMFETYDYEVSTQRPTEFPSPELFARLVAEGEVRMCELFDITLRTGDTRYFTNHDEDILWGNPSTRYTALPIIRGQVKSHMDLQVDNTSVSMAGISSELKDLLLSHVLEEAQIAIKRIFWNLEYAAGYELTIFKGWVNVRWNRNAILLECTSILDSLGIKVPRLTYQSPCNHLVFDSLCGINPEPITTKPTGFSDPTSTWDFEEDAFDSDDETYARSEIHGGATSEFVEYTLAEEVTCFTVTFDADKFSELGVEQSNVQIDIYNGSWITVYNDNNHEDHTPYAVTVTQPVPITKLRVRMTNSHSLDRAVKLYNLEITSSKYKFVGTCTSDSDTLYTLNDSLFVNPVDDSTKFVRGEVRITSGNNSGERRQIISTEDGIIHIQLQLPYKMKSGDTFEYYVGCDLTPETCRDRFNNLAGGYLGFVYIPAPEEVLL